MNSFKKLAIICTLLFLSQNDAFSASTVKHAASVKSQNQTLQNTTQSPPPAVAETPKEITPEPEKKEEPSIPHHHFFLGASGSNLEVFYSKDSSTTTRFNLTLGYIPTVHHQINISYSHEPSSIFSSTLTGTDIYGFQYRYLLSEKMENSFYVQPLFNVYRINGNKLISTDNSYISFGVSVGKNFTIFDSESFVFSPSVSYEKVEKQDARFKFTPIAFGFYFF